MRTAGLPNFRKLWGRIYGDLEKGTYTIKIHNNYNVQKYDANKYFVMITSNALGGKNYFLGITSTVVGGLCAIAAITFLFAYKNR